MRLIYHPWARYEIKEAYRYYQLRDPQIADALLDEAERTASNILDRPLRWRTISGEYRRALLRRFPYGIIYAVRGGNVSIIAFAHLHREPKYWKDREI